MKAKHFERPVRRSVIRQILSNSPYLPKWALSSRSPVSGCRPKIDTTLLGSATGMGLRPGRPRGDELRRLGLRPLGDGERRERNGEFLRGEGVRPGSRVGVPSAFFGASMLGVG
eukprot:Mycagemm_TRINITY_DN9406_c0_g1::TRINITY_DN9406_c0_g1_i1::g.3061::m.3061 type:complete len:114 gc:universal TRINITY_DN9406_c0_g1_i1:585-926(+)